MSIHFVKKGREQPAAMPEDMDYHGAWKSRGIGYGTKQVFKKQLTTNNYADSESNPFDMRLFARATVQVDEIGKTNGIKFNVLGCIDPKGVWNTIKADQAVLAGQTGYLDIEAGSYNYLKIQVASSAAGQPGKVDAYINGKTP